MSEDPAPYGKSTKSVEEKPKKKRLPKKPMEITKSEKRIIMSIARKAKELREKTEMSYESFAVNAGINRISYYRFEKSSSTADIYSVALLVKVISALKMTPEEFFKDIR